MSDQKYKVLITTSGTGSRLNEMTKYLNKALVKIGNKPAISYIIEAYPKEVPLVITVGYFAEQVKEFLSMAYPDRKFEFVQVDKYEGPGTSLGFSMLQAEKNLQCPFIFHCCDTIVTEDIPEPVKNWIGGYIMDKETTDFPWQQYRTHKVVDDKVIKLNEKGDSDFESAHIGLIGVKDYDIFWQTLKSIYELDKENTGHSDVHVVSKMIESGISFELVPYRTWLDTGNPTALEKTRKVLVKTSDFIVLEKQKESIYFFEDFVIKFFQDENILQNRLKRTKILQGLIPQLEVEGKNFYRYKFVEGDLFSEIATSKNFADFFDWAEKNLWLNVDVDQNINFSDVCYKFYHDKTLQRVESFFNISGLEDKEESINRVVVPKISEIIKIIDFDWLCGAIPKKIHGDLVLDNVLKTKESWCLLDWRQDFAGLLEAGDMYYDFGKLSHNLVVNHNVINNDLFTIEITDKEISYTIKRKDNLVECEESFFALLEKKGYDTKKVKVLRALIWLNMSPLHHDPFNKFLFYSGKLNLWRELNNN